jgi:hypothetical protein
MFTVAGIRKLHIGTHTFRHTHRAWFVPGVAFFLPPPLLRWRGRRSAGRGQQIAEISTLLLAGSLGRGGELA